MDETEEVIEIKCEYGDWDVGDDPMDARQLLARAAAAEELKIEPGEEIVVAEPAPPPSRSRASIENTTEQLRRVAGRMRRETEKGAAAPRDPRRAPQTFHPARTLDQLAKDATAPDQPEPAIAMKTSDDVIATHLAQESAKLVGRSVDGVIAHVPFECRDFRQFLEHQLGPIEAANGDAVSGREPLGGVSLAYIPRSQQSARAASSSSSSSSRKIEPPKVVPPQPPFAAWTAPVECVYAYAMNIRQFATMAGLPRRITPLPTAPHACPRKHVERMLVGVYGNARPCVFKQSCVGAVQYKMVMREYMSPEEYERGQKRSVPESDPCYLCYLLLIFVQFVFLSNQAPGATLKIRQPFYHVIDKPGEYKSEAIIPPISSSVDDTKLTDLLCDTPSTSAENTFGLTAPLVAFQTNNYTVGSIRVQVDGEWKQVPCLKESEALLFTEHAQAFEPLPQVDPYQYIKTKELYTPTTIFIMNRLFSPDNTEHVIGAERMRTYGQYIDAANHERCLPYRWCLQAKKDRATRFPWQYIFDTDLRVTVAHLDEIVERGCIDVDTVMRCKRTADLNVVCPELSAGTYAARLREEVFACRLFYVAYRVRVAVLTTLLRVYPQSKNSNRDITVRTRAEILLKWNIAHLHPLVKRDTFDEDVDCRAVARAARVEPDSHYFPEDDIHRRFERTVERRQTPREYLVAWLGARPELLPFDELRADLARRYFVQRNYGAPPAHASYFEHPLACLLYTLPGHSIFAAVHTRVNWAAALHDSTKRQLVDAEREYAAADAAYVRGERTFDELQRLDARRRLVRERRYNLRLFILTHLDAIARARHHDEWADSFFMQRAPHPTNPNYAMRHYDEVEPYDTRMYHEGMLPDIAKYMCCVPFPDQKDAGVRENNTSTNHLFRMIGLLLPRNNTVRTNNKQHIKLCTEHAAYRKLAANVAMVSFTGAYRHADYLPPLDHCLYVREIMVAPQAKHFMNWQRCFKSLAVLAMREYVVFMVRLCLPYHYYLVHQYPYWTQYARQTYALANVVRLCARRGHSLSAIQYDVQRVVKPKTQEPYHFNASIAAIIDRLVGEDKTIDWTQCRHEMQIDELRALCLQLHTININRARASVPRVSMPAHLNQAIIAKAYSVPRQAPIDLEWLLEFNFGVTEPPEQVNVSTLTIRLLEYAFYFILRGPHKTNSVVLALSSIPHKDYEVVDAFFFNLFTHYSATVIELDDPDLARRQYEAVLRRNDMDAKRASVSPWAYSLMMAPCCGTIRSYVTQEDGALLYGGNRVCIDPFSNTVVCGVKTEYDTKKKTYRVYTQLDRRLSQVLLTGQKLVDLHRVLKRIMKLVPQELHNRFYQQPKCGSIALVPVPLIGRIAQITTPKVTRTSIASPTTNAFTICERCGGIMFFSTKFYGANGLCCQKCCIAHAIEAHTPVCVAKYHRIKIDTPVHVFQVIDDRPVVGTHRITRMYVCHRCYTRKTAGYVKHAAHILSATSLARAKHFLEKGMNFTVALASGEPLGDYFDARVSNYLHRSRARLDRALAGQPDQY